MSTALRTYYRGHDLTTLVDNTGASRFYHYDHQGTTQCLTDSTGAVTDRFASDAWGVQVKRTGNSINRQWYVGGYGYYRDPSNTIDYSRRRFLDNRRGAWLSVDLHNAELRDPTTEHSYAYVENRPTTHIDPSGKVPLGPNASKCVILGILGKGQYPGDRPPALVERVINILNRAGFPTLLFPSNKPNVLQIDTLTPNQQIKPALLASKEYACCWCVLGYSRGGGQAFDVAKWAQSVLPGFPLEAALTIEAIQVTPAYWDAETHAVGSRIPGARYHGHWYAEWPVPPIVGIKGDDIPAADFSLYMAGTNHVSIQDFIPPRILSRILERRCYYEKEERCCV